MKLVMRDQPDRWRCGIGLRQHFGAPRGVLDVDDEGALEAAVGIAIAEALEQSRRKGANEDSEGFLPDGKRVAAFADVVQKRRDRQFGRDGLRGSSTLREDGAEDVEAVQLLDRAHLLEQR